MTSPLTSDPVLSARGLSHRFGDRRVLSGVDLDLRPHEVLAVMGVSGVW